MAGKNLKNHDHLCIETEVWLLEYVSVSKHVYRQADMWFSSSICLELYILSLIY